MCRGGDPWGATQLSVWGCGSLSQPEPALQTEGSSRLGMAGKEETVRPSLRLKLKGEAKAPPAGRGLICQPPAC